MEKKINDRCKPIFYILDEKVQSIISLNKMYKIVAYLLFLVFSSIIIVLLFNFTMEKFIKLVVPLGVILSAAIASLSVLKSINNTNILEEKKKKQEQERAKLRLSLYLSDITDAFNILKFTSAPNYLAYIQIYEYLSQIRVLIENDKEVLNLIHIEDILLILSSMRRKPSSVTNERIESEKKLIDRYKTNLELVINKIVKYTDIKIHSTIS